MAYKFQLGSAILSGSVIQEGSVEAAASALSGSSLTVPDGGLTLNGTAVTANAAELNLLDGVSGLVQGDFTKLAGVDASAAELNHLDGIGDAAYNAAADSVVFFDADDSKLKYEAANDFASTIAGDGLVASSGVIAVQVSGAVKLAGDKVGISGSIAGNGLTAVGGIDSISSLTLNANPDSFSVGIDGLTLAANVAGAGLGLAAGVLSASVDDSSIEINSDVIRVKASGITNAMLGGSIANAKLANSAVTVTAGDGLKTGGSVSLGGSVTLDIDVSDFAGTGLSGDGSENLNIDAAQTGITSIYNTALKIGRGASDDNIDFGTDDSIVFNIDGGEKFRVASGSVTAAVATTFEDNVVIEGNLTVVGSSVSIETGEFVVTSSIKFEGISPDANEVVLTAADAQGSSKTITLPDLTGHVGLFAAAATETISATAAEINLLDAGAGSTAGCATGDGVIIFRGANGNNASKVLLSDILSLSAGAALTVVAKSNGTNLEIDKLNIFGDLGANATVTLPASAAGLIGKSIFVKAKDLTSGAKIIINTQAADQKIDGANSIELESPYAAVRLVYVAADDWRVF